MAKSKKTRRSRFEGINLESLNQEAAKVTNKEIERKEEQIIEEKKEEKTNELIVKTEGKSPEITAKETEKKLVKRKKGRPKTSKRQPLNTAIEPKNKQRLDFLAMLNGGSVADQLNNILNRYFSEIERVDELIEVFEAKKRAR